MLELTKINECQETESEVFHPVDPELEKLLEEDEGMRLKSVGKSFLIFVFFEAMSLLCEGRLIRFDVCESIFFLLFAAFLTIFIIYLVIYYNHEKSKYAHYAKVTSNSLRFNTRSKLTCPSSATTSSCVSGERSQVSPPV